MAVEEGVGEALGEREPLAERESLRRKVGEGDGEEEAEGLAVGAEVGGMPVVHTHGEIVRRSCGRHAEVMRRSRGGHADL